MLTSEGTIRALLSQDRKHSKRFKISIFIDPYWSVTISLALEKSLSISVDIGAINRMLMAIKDKLENHFCWADSSYYFNRSNTISTGLQQYTLYLLSSILKIVAFCSFIYILYLFGRSINGP